ncbi:MAG: penicillin acylase family protein [Crocinitomicaceae bacterium]|nr:penicillin acylase family protein [Crocinitomicaceae bacterium]
MVFKSLLASMISVIIFPISLFAQINPKSISIIRDQFGVPHIYAKTDKEASYGLAWAHSEDNFKTIQETFLPAVGKLGLYSGKDGASLDYVVQLLKCRKTAENNIKNLSNEVIAVIEGYIEGINEYAKKHPEEVLVKGSFPMTVMDYLTGYNLVIHFFSDTGQTLQTLLSDKIEPLKELGDEKEKVKSIGSNAFAISRKKTTDGKTYLNINTHQPLEGPFSWYEAHINSEEGWNMLGSLFPGSPFPMIGSNEYLGWTHTFNYPDLVDIYQLEMHPRKKNTYKLDNEWLDLEVFKAKLNLKVLGIKVVLKKKAYWSVHGPVVKNKSGYFSFRSNALENISSIDQWYQMNKANNWEEFKTAIEIEGLPRFNIMYADREDNIYYLSSGKIPKRIDGYDWENVLPGNKSDLITTGYMSLDELPQLLNPKHGYLFNTNNSPYNAAHPEDNLDDKDFDENIGYTERENNRSIRFMELIKLYPKLCYEDFKRIKYDTQYPDSLIGLFQLNDVFNLIPSDYPELEELINLIQQWDRKANIDNVGAAQWSIYYKELSKKIDEKDLYGCDKIPDSILIECLISTKSHLLKYFNKLAINLGEQQVHVRGNKEIPIPGLVDMIAAMSTEPYKDEMVRAVSGESYIMLARYSEHGVELETILPYGESCNPNSIYFTDQMQCYANQQLKPMSLSKEIVLNNALRIYNPGQ